MATILLAHENLNNDENDVEELEVQNNILVNNLSFTPVHYQQHQNIFNKKQFINMSESLSSGDGRYANLDDSKDKIYFCQRCLKHIEEHTRRAHKPLCRYQKCQCLECQMVIKRRRLNKALTNQKLGKGKLKRFKNPTRAKSRHPKCARCAAHGKESSFRGHKKAVCPFRICKCEKCYLVEERRRRMAWQIKLRRWQMKPRVETENIHFDQNFKLFFHPVDTDNNYLSESSKIELMLKQQNKLSQYMALRHGHTDSITQCQQWINRDKKREELMKILDLPIQSQPKIYGPNLQHLSQLPSHFHFVDQFTPKKRHKSTALLLF
uniref:DM domain-containing protein n=1 Tax=Meloidogyne enterolobii TaxID=390850 RepID=A0A6V7VJZ4_MELEN|nr:unnamed protein product [Meloidogyne enterolobii]